MFYTSFYRCLFLFLSIQLCIGPWTLLAMQQSSHIDLNPSYVNLAKEVSNIADVISQISTLDDQNDSPLNALKNHMLQGFCIAKHNEMVSILAYAESVLQRSCDQLNYDQVVQLYDDVVLLQDRMVKGDLNVNPQLLETTDTVRSMCCEKVTTQPCQLDTCIINKNLDVLGKTILRKHVHTKQGVYIEGNLKVGKKAKFKDKVTFEDNIYIEGTLSASDAIVSNLRIDGSLIIPSFTPAGVVHNNNSGVLFSSLVVNADIAPATIANDKLATISSADIPNYIVVRDGSGNFATNMITLDGMVINPTDAATKAYVDSVVSSGLVAKVPAVVVSVANETLSGFPTIDGVVFPSGTNRILLTGQTNPIENGLWVAQAGAWIRPFDFPSGTAAGEAYVLILSGTTYAASSWLCNTPAAIIDTDPLGFVLFSISASTTGANVGAGTGLIFRDKTGNDINFKSLIQSSHIVITNNANDITLATDATSANTANTIVARNASGNFSAGVVSVTDSVVSTSLTVTPFGTAGVVHNNASGLLSSSLIVNADITNATISNAKLATISSANTAGNIVVRDGSGNFATNMITLNGTVTNPTDAATKAYVDSATSATTGANVGAGTGLIFRDKTGSTLNFKSLIQGSHVVVTNNANDITLATDATNLNTPSTIVARDAAGNFSASIVSMTDGVVSGNILLGNSTTTTGNIEKNGNSFIHNFGTNNTFVGVNAGNFVTTGTGQNSGFGINALASLTTGSNNIAIGYQSGQTLATGSGNIYINGTAGTTNENSTTRIGTSQTRAFIAGIDGIGVSGNGVVVDMNGQLGITLSSKKFKHNIEDMGDDSASVLDLRPVTFVYNNDETQTKQYGLIAEEVNQCFPDIVSKNEDGMPYTVRYHLLPVLLLNELKKQHAIIAQQQATIDEIKTIHVTVQEMHDTIELLKKEIQKYIINIIA